MNLAKNAFKIFVTILTVSTAALADQSMSAQFYEQKYGDKYYEHTNKSNCGVRTGDKIISAILLPLVIAEEPFVQLFRLNKEEKKMGLVNWYKTVTSKPCLVEISDLERSLKHAMNKNLEVLSQAEAQTLGISYAEMASYNNNIAAINYTRIEILQAYEPTTSAKEVNQQWQTKLKKNNVPQEAQKVLVLVALKQLERLNKIETFSSQLDEVKDKADSIFVAFEDSFYNFQTQASIFYLSIGLCGKHEELDAPEDIKREGKRLYSELVSKYGRIVGDYTKLKALSISENDTVETAAAKFLEAQKNSGSISGLITKQLFVDYQEFRKLKQIISKAKCK